MYKRLLYIINTSIILILGILPFIYISITSNNMNNTNIIVLGDSSACEIDTFISSPYFAMMKFKYIKESDVFNGMIPVLKNIKINLENKSTIVVDIRGTTTSFVTLFIQTETFPNELNIPQCILEKDIYLNKGQNQFKVAIRDLEIKDWWFKDYNLAIRDKRVKADLSKVKKIGIGISNTLKIPENVSFDLNVHSFKANYSFSYLLRLLIPALFLLLVILIIDIALMQNFRITAGDEFDLNSSETDLIKIKITNLIGRYYNNRNMDINHASDIAKIDKAQIEHVLKRNYKLNFKQYLIKVRLTEAQRLLKESNCSVKEISTMVGFKHVSILNREFKKHIGKTPTEIRSVN